MSDDKRDNELDHMLKSLKAAKPTDLQMQKWKNAVNENVRSNTNMYSTSKTKWALQLVAATVVGVMIGAVATKSHTPPAQQSHVVAENSSDDATFEHSHDNLD